MAAITSFKVQCPSCETNVTIKNPSLVGKKIDCPKCKYRFVVEAPADLESDEEETPKDEAAKGDVKKDKKDKKGGKSKKGAKTDVRDDDDGPPKKKNMTLMIGLGLGGLAILLLVVALLGGIFDDDPAKSTGGGTQNPVKGSGATTGTGTETTAPVPEQKTAAPPASTYRPGISREISNLLPNESQWVANVNVQDVLVTPAGTTLFDRTKPTSSLVTENAGFPVESIDRIVAAGGDDGKWTFTVIRTRAEFKIDAVKTALEVNEPTKTIKQRDYFIVKDNPLFNAVGNYVQHKLTELKFKVDPPAEPRVLTACIVDTKTLIVADQAVMERFLEADGQPKFISSLATNAPPVEPKTPAAPGTPGGGMAGTPPVGTPGSPAGGMAGTPPVGSPGSPAGGIAGTPPGGMAGTPPGGMAGIPPGGMAGIPPGGMAGTPPGIMTPPGGPGSASPAAPRVFTSVPNYRTVEPALKFMLNQLESDKKPVINFAIRMKTQELVKALLGGVNLFGGKFKPALPPGTKGGEVIPNSIVVGVILHEFTSAKFNLQIATDLDQEEQAKEVQSLLRILMPVVAGELTKEVGFPVKNVDGENNNNNGFNGGAGGPGMAPGSPGIPPGGPGIPLRPSNSDIKSKKPLSAGVVTPLQGGSPGGPGFPGGPGMGPGGPGFPGGPGMGPGGPGFPGGPGTGPGGPGFPGGPGGVPADENKSSVTLTRQDRTLIVTIDLDWKKEYPNTIAADLRNYFDSVAGESLLMGGRHPWQKIPAGYANIQAKGKVPRAAYNRRSTAGRMGLPYGPEQRVSWMTELLPSMGYDTLYRAIDKDLGWNSPTNLGPARAWIPEFLDASQTPETWRAKLGSVPGKDLGATHFVGLAGIGEDAADLPDTPEFAKRLGIFGYDRETTLADVQKGDGLSNTIFMAQVSPNIARPWIRGGGATVSGVSGSNSFEPFNVKHADGEFGSYVLMADGSVRFIKAKINDQLFKALVTYKGGEKMDGLDEFVVKPELGGSKLKTPPVVLPKSENPVVSNIPKDWQSVGVRVYGSRFGIGMPPGKIDSLTDRADEKIFACKPNGSALTFAVYAIYKAYTPAQSTDELVRDEINRFVEKYSLKLNGDPVASVPLATSKGWDFKATPQGGDGKYQYVCRLWLHNGTRFVMAVSGDQPPKPSDLETYFKSAVFEGTAPIPARVERKWIEYVNIKYGFHMRMPGKFNEFTTADNLNVVWPEDIEAGATLSLSFVPFKFSSPDEPAKVKSDLEEAAKKGTFGQLFIGAVVKAENDKDHDGKPALKLNVHKGDVPYRTLVIHNNRDSIAILSARISDPSVDIQEFFNGFHFGLPKPKDKENPGGPGVPPGGAAVPPVPPGKGPMPPGMPPMPTPPKAP